MNTSDDVKEKEEELERAESDMEEVDDEAELNEKKQENRFNVENNRAQSMVNLNNLKGNVYIQYQNEEAEKSINISARKYDLRKPKDCIEFVETYKDSKYLALAIILSLFEAVPLGDLPELELKLLNYFPKSTEKENGYISQKTSYLAVNTILNVIGGQRFKRSDDRQCVGMGEDSMQMLANILEQFPVLRSTVIRWLIDINADYKYQTTFESYQMVTAFVRIISLDFDDAERRIFPQLYSNPANAELLGVIGYRLYMTPEHVDNAKKMISQWVRTDYVWFWKSAYMTYFFIKENGMDFPYEKELCKAIRKKYCLFKRNDLTFIAALLAQSKHCRTMFAQVLHDLYEKAGTREVQMIGAQTYINLVRQCYYQVNSSLTELPLVACDTKKQQEDISEIVGKAMSQYHMRRQLYFILKAYLKELSYYHVSERIMNHISAFFFNMMLYDTGNGEDVLFFLNGCQNKTATQIYRALLQYK